MKSYRLYQVDSFTKNKFTGNPAGVVTNADGLSEEQMQKIAGELNNSETAFILRADAESHDVHVRFFTPSMEVPMCGHATIAAHYVRAFELKLDSSQVIQKVGAGILPVDLISTDIDGKSDYKVIMTQGDITFDNPLDFDIVSVICDALDISSADLTDNAPIQIVSTGHSKVMVCIKSYALLKQLNPDFEELIEISESIGCNGFLVFSKDTPEDDYFINARMFGPALGINEDPVNGSSGGALGAYLVKHELIDSANKSQIQFKVRQGFSVGRPGEVEVLIDLDAEGNPVLGKIIGDAVIVFQTTLDM
ncbi:MAG: PhzF family isomerase [Cocleimonas sp.]